jgi:hypothetical protein
MEELRIRSSGPLAFATPIEDRMITILTPALGRAFQTETRIGQDADLTELAIAIAAYSAEHGQAPAKLDDLAPAYFKQVPKDRFNEQPLTYFADGKHWMIRSVGPDLKDDAVAKPARNDDVVVGTRPQDAKN